jgi:hypothetical protein
MIPLLWNISIGDKYSPAMEMREEAAAAEYFERLVGHSMGFGYPREEAERIERENLGYFAGYYDHETRERVERLFACAHPIFGKISEHVPTPEECLLTGMQIGLGIRKAAG